MSQSGLVVEGLKESIDALRVIDPELKKRLNKEMVGAVKPIITKTKTNVPTRPARNYGDWAGVLDWNPAQVKRGISTSTGSGRSRGGVRGQFRLMNKSAAGVVFESMGRNGPYSTSGQFLIRNFDARSRPPRLLIRTWKEERGMTKVGGAMKGVVNQIEARVNQATR